MDEDGPCIETGDEGGPFASDWIEAEYRKCNLSQGLTYSQKITLFVDDAIQLGIFKPAESDSELGFDGPSFQPSRSSIQDALWSINRRAKRCRDLAQANYMAGEYFLASYYKSWKERYYQLKGQVLHHMIIDGHLKVLGYHLFEEGLWAELLGAEGFTFHRPCAPMEGMVALPCDRIENKPKQAGEIAIDDACRALTDYLLDKPKAAIYQWPARVTIDPLA